MGIAVRRLVGRVTTLFWGKIFKGLGLGVDLRHRLCVVSCMLYVGLVLGWIVGLGVATAWRVGRRFSASS